MFADPTLAGGPLDSRRPRWLLILVSGKQEETNMSNNKFKRAATRSRVEKGHGAKKDGHKPGPPYDTPLD